jgi:hypothetical protein
MASLQGRSPPPTSAPRSIRRAPTEAEGLAQRLRRAAVAEGGARRRLVAPRSGTRVGAASPPATEERPPERPPGAVRSPNLATRLVRRAVAERGPTKELRGRVKHV